MTINDLFEKYEDEYLHFERIENKRSKKSDLHVFLLLDELFPKYDNIIDHSDYDKIYLNINSDDLEKLTDDDVIELRRCGVSYDAMYESLFMFV